MLHDGAGVDVDGDDVVVFGGHCQLHVERTERSGDGEEKECFILFFETNVSDSPETTTNAFIRGCAGMYPPAEGSCARAALRVVVAVVVCLEQCVRWSVRKRAKSLGVL